MKPFWRVKMAVEGCQRAWWRWSCGGRKRTTVETDKVNEIGLSFWEKVGDGFCVCRREEWGDNRRGHWDHRVGSQADTSHPHTAHLHCHWQSCQSGSFLCFKICPPFFLGIKTLGFLTDVFFIFIFFLEKKFLFFLFLTFFGKKIGFLFLFHWKKLPLLFSSEHIYK